MTKCQDGFIIEISKAKENRKMWAVCNCMCEVIKRFNKQSEAVQFINDIRGEYPGEWFEVISYKRLNQDNL